VEKLIHTLAESVMGYIRKNICPAVTLERLLRKGVAAEAA